jgi:hypothetical protein
MPSSLALTMASLASDVPRDVASVAVYRYVFVP